MRHGRLVRAASGTFSVLQPVLAVGVSAWLVLGAIDALTGEEPVAGRSGTLPLGPASVAAVPAASEESSGPELDAPASSGLRIEIHTPDPNVRIIWFAANEPAGPGGR
jgi:hypothetical protein